MVFNLDRSSVSIFGINPAIPLLVASADWVKIENNVITWFNEGQERTITDFTGFVVRSKGVVVVQERHIVGN